MTGLEVNPGIVVAIVYAVAGFVVYFHALVTA